MEIPQEPQESFTIKADILGNGTPNNIQVYPKETYYLLILDDFELTTIAHEGEGWVQVDGNLDQEDIDMLGEAIEKHVK